MENLIEKVRAALTATPARWQTLTATLSPATLEQPPAPGEWSAAQCLGHLMQAETEVFPRRVRNMLAGEDFADFTPAPAVEAYAGLSLAALAAEFARLRAESLDLLAGIQPSDLDRTTRHPQLGQVTLAELLHTWVAHDLNHTMQAERALMQPFITGSGPWRIRFAEHVLPKPA